MCIVIDTNTLARVFDSTNKEHNNFQPVYEWIINGNGKIVYGGETYIGELLKANRYYKLILQLNKAKKAINISENLVNEHEKIVKELKKHRDFDDPHIVALIRASKCKLICTDEKRAIPFFKNIELYEKSTDRPKIYTSLKNKGLLIDRNISKVCMQ
jgi:predicted nucleic acid-binding protein